MGRNENEYVKRIVILYVFIGLLAFLLTGRLFSLQIIHGDEYKEITATRLSKTTPQKAPRGEILDRYGRPMVSNRTGYSITITKTEQTDEELNSVIGKLLSICEKEGQKYNDALPVTYEKPFKYTYYGTNEEKKGKYKCFSCIP